MPQSKFLQSQGNKQKKGAENSAPEIEFLNSIPAQD
jgi:hypothetical protein